MRSGVARRVIELPGTSTELPFAARLQVIGDAIEQRRSPLERVAISFLALARLPLPFVVLAELTGASEPDLDTTVIAGLLVELTGSDIVRRTAAGDLLLHPVFRNLYRTSLRRHNPDSLRERHRALAEYYYSAAHAELTRKNGAP
jgi:hypothetical protein